MNAATYITLGAMALICIISAVLVFHHDYEDGLIGRVALVAMMFGGGMLIARTVHWRADIDPAVCVFVWGVAAFFARHCYRFMRALIDPSYQWRKRADKGPEHRLPPSISRPGCP